MLISSYEMYIHIVKEEGGFIINNIIILTHGDLSKGILQSAKFLIGEVDNVKTMSITLQQSIEEIVKELEDKMNSFNNNQLTFILTDIPGGSTTQCAIKCVEGKENIFLLTGVNLVLFLQVYFLKFNSNKEDLFLEIEKIVQEAQKSIAFVNVNEEIALSEDGEL